MQYILASVASAAGINNENEKMPDAASGSGPAISPSRETNSSAPQEENTVVPIIIVSTSKPVENVPTTQTVAATTTTKITTTTMRTTPMPSVTVSTVSPEHVLNQVDKILQNVSRGNVTGIVDQSLGIRAPMPVRNLVNGIMKLVFCDPISRLFGRCRGNNTIGKKLEGKLAKL